LTRSGSLATGRRCPTRESAVGELVLVHGARIGVAFAPNYVPFVRVARPMYIWTISYCAASMPIVLCTADETKGRTT